jgi:hypothetical protein
VSKRIVLRSRWCDNGADLTGEVCGSGVGDGGGGGGGDSVVGDGWSVTGVVEEIVITLVVLEEMLVGAGTVGQSARSPNGVSRK